MPYSMQLTEQIPNDPPRMGAKSTTTSNHPGTPPGKKQVNLLGYNVSINGISGDQEKTRAITTMNPPSSESEVRRFFGMIWYYRQTIPNYAKIAAPIIALARKNVPWGGGGVEQQKTFDDLKNVV